MLYFIIYIMGNAEHLHNLRILRANRKMYKWSYRCALSTESDCKNDSNFVYAVNCCHIT